MCRIDLFSPYTLVFCRLGCRLQLVDESVTVVLGLILLAVKVEVVFFIVIADEGFYRQRFL